VRVFFRLGVCVCRGGAFIAGRIIIFREQYVRVDERVCRYGD